MNYILQSFSRNADEKFVTSVELIKSVCDGTLWIFDRSCEMYNRLWCLYEAYTSVTFVRNDKEYKFDVYTPLEDKDIDGTYGAVGITDGYIPSDHCDSNLKKERETNFPLDRVLLQAIMNLDIKLSLTSNEEDRKFILNNIAGQSVEEPILDNDIKYEGFNNVVKSLFLAPMMERIQKDKDKTDVDRCLAIMNSIRPRKKYIYLSNNSGLDDAYTQKIFNMKLPSTIEEVRIFFQGRYHVDGKKVQELENYKGLPTESVNSPNTSIGKTQG